MVMVMMVVFRSVLLNDDLAASTSVDDIHLRLLIVPATAIVVELIHNDDILLLLLELINHNRRIVELIVVEIGIHEHLLLLLELVLLIPILLLLVVVPVIVVVWVNGAHHLIHLLIDRVCILVNDSRRLIALPVNDECEVAVDFGIVVLGDHLKFLLDAMSAHQVLDFDRGHTDVAVGDGSLIQHFNMHELIGIVVIQIEEKGLVIPIGILTTVMTFLAFLLLALQVEADERRHGADQVNIV